MKFNAGDRVRVVTSESSYTGCRGSVVQASTEVPPGPDGEPLGCYVAIDGENGRTRPFLSAELEVIPMARVRSPGAASRPEVVTSPTR